MIVFEIEEAKWASAESYLKERYPALEVSLFVCDKALEQLGFVENAPCAVGFDISREEYLEILEDLLQLEIDAFNTPDGELPPENDPSYKEYMAYGWLYDGLSKAHEA